MENRDFEINLGLARARELAEWGDTETALGIYRETLDQLNEGEPGYAQVQSAVDALEQMPPDDALERGDARSPRAAGLLRSRKLRWGILIVAGLLDLALFLGLNSRVRTVVDQAALISPAEPAVVAAGAAPTLAPSPTAVPVLPWTWSPSIPDDALLKIFPTWVISPTIPNPATAGPAPDPTAPPAVDSGRPDNPGRGGNGDDHGSGKGDDHGSGKSDDHGHGKGKD